MDWDWYCDTSFFISLNEMRKAKKACDVVLHVILVLDRHIVSSL